MSLDRGNIDKTKWPDLSRTRDALTAYTAADALLDARLHTVETEEEMLALQEAYKAALVPLHDAFYQDTKDRNRRETVGLMSHHDILKMVQAWEAWKATQEVSDVR